MNKIFLIALIFIGGCASDKKAIEWSYVQALDSVVIHEDTLVLADEPGKISLINDSTVVLLAERTPYLLNLRSGRFSNQIMIPKINWDSIVAMSVEQTYGDINYIGLRSLAHSVGGYWYDEKQQQLTLIYFPKFLYTYKDNQEKTIQRGYLLFLLNYNSKGEYTGYHSTPRTAPGCDSCGVGFNYSYYNYHDTMYVFNSPLISDESKYYKEPILLLYADRKDSISFLQVMNKYKFPKFYHFQYNISFVEINNQLYFSNEKEIYNLQTNEKLNIPIIVEEEYIENMFYDSVKNNMIVIGAHVTNNPQDVPYGFIYFYNMDMKEIVRKVKIPYVWYGKFYKDGDLYVINKHEKDEFYKIYKYSL